MNTTTNGFLELAPTPTVWVARRMPVAEREGHPPDARDPESLRRVAWEIGERREMEFFTPTASHVGLAMVSPAEGFAHWRILTDWVDETARARGDAWNHCRPILRLYDVSYIVFNGFNAHRMQDHNLHSLCGQMLFKLPRAGTWQLAEVGFLLRSGEFIPAARSQGVPFAPDSGSSRGSHAGLLVDPRGGVEEVGNVWDQQRLLHERRSPRLRQPLRLAAFSFASLATGQHGTLARFVSELASGQAARGHEVHVFVPATEQFNAPREVSGVKYHPLALQPTATPLETARAFGRAAEEQLRALPHFDLIHMHEWMAAVGPRRASCPTVLSLTSVEATRRNGTEPSPLSLEIQEVERTVAQTVDCVLAPEWLRQRAAAELGVEAARVQAFPMEGRLPNEWECPLDPGRVKMDIGFGPLDRLLLFIGPLEHAAGVDLLVEALPTMLGRAGNLRVAFAGSGNMHGWLQQRAHQLGVAHAVRLLGHVEGPFLPRLLRSAEAVVLPSRYRVPFDDAVVDLARRAGRAVVTTHGGPAHLIRHEENGILTYDNPGSMVWAVDRILGDPAHTERMGQSARRAEGSAVVWTEVGRYYLELCAAQFPELTELRW